MSVAVAIEELKEKNRQTRSKAILANNSREIKYPASSVPVFREKFFLKFSLCFFYGFF